MRLLAPFLLAMIGWLAVATSGVDARDVVATNFNAPSVDLTSVIEYLETSDKEIVIPVPADGDGAPTAMTVTAKGPGDVHRFAVVTLYNEEPLPRELVFVARWPGYVGSGLVWPHFGGTQLLSVQAAPGLPPQRLSSTQADTYSLTLDPGETVTVVAELAGAQATNLSLWHKLAYDKQQQQLSFFRGVVLGIATLTAVFMVCLFIIRLQPAFPAAALFAFSSVMFIALEFGYLPVLQTLLPSAPGMELRVRAIVEALMTAGALACLLTFLELLRRSPVIGYPVLGAFVASLLLAVSAWFAPEVSMGLARILLFVTAVGGFALIILFWRQGMIRAQASLVTWCFLLLWTLCSFAAALGWLNLEVVSPVLAWGLVLVLLTMAFTLTQFAFNQGVVNSRFFEDSGRRGLALAGAEQVVWDWNEDNGTLFVGPELERVLGHTQGRITRGGLKGWLELIHPGDRGDYVGVVESAVQRGRGTFGHQFRVRRGDGTYRWFQLRARSLPGDLGRAVRCIGTLADITAAKRSEEQLLADAVRDRITGLPYEALFMDRLERAMQRADAEENDGLQVLIVDLDRFKHVNESLGFAVGDSLLLTVARRLTTLIGPNDTLARMHGDRFAIILNTSQPARDVAAYVDHLRKLVARPVPLKPQEVFLTACIGVAQYRRDKTRPEQLFKDAEIALYRAKRQGKDVLVTFTEDMREGAASMVSLEEDLRFALERHQIEVAYQPVMRLDNRRLAGFEALVRWRHEDLGVLEPEAFMRLAEDLGLMNEFGRFVLTQATRQLGIWQRAYRSDEPLFMTVNVSSRELINRDLVDEVKTVLSREDLVPGSLKLELTETILMENPELSVKILEKLQLAGVGIACDDFGTGYSALSHLRRLPFDTIKIDRCFLEGEADDEAAQIILEAIVLLAHDLGMDTVVEGVETADQADRLRELGCDFGQGFLFGEPMSARQVMEAFGGSQSISGRSTRKGIPSAAFWQKIIRRNDEAVEPADSRRGANKTSRPAIAASGDAAGAIPAENLARAQGATTPVAGDAVAQEQVVAEANAIGHGKEKPVSAASPVGRAPMADHAVAATVLAGAGVAAVTAGAGQLAAAQAGAGARVATGNANQSGGSPDRRGVVPPGTRPGAEQYRSKPPVQGAVSGQNTGRGPGAAGGQGAMGMPSAQRGTLATGPVSSTPTAGAHRVQPTAVPAGASRPGGTLVPPPVRGARLLTPGGAAAADAARRVSSPGAPAVGGTEAVHRPSGGVGPMARPPLARRPIAAPAGLGGRLPGAVPPEPLGGPGRGVGQHGRTGYAPAALAVAGWGAQKANNPAVEQAGDRAAEAGPAMPVAPAPDSAGVAEPLIDAPAHDAVQAIGLTEDAVVAGGAVSDEQGFVEAASVVEAAVAAEIAVDGPQVDDVDSAIGVAESDVTAVEAAADHAETTAADVAETDDADIAEAELQGGAADLQSAAPVGAEADTADGDAVPDALGSNFALEIEPEEAGPADHDAGEPASATSADDGAEIAAAPEAVVDEVGEPASVAFADDSAVIAAAPDAVVDEVGQDDAGPAAAELQDALAETAVTGEPETAEADVGVDRDVEELSFTPEQAEHDVVEDDQPSTEDQADDAPEDAAVDDQIAVPGDLMRGVSVAAELNGVNGKADHGHEAELIIAENDDAANADAATSAEELAVIVQHLAEETAEPENVEIGLSPPPRNAGTTTTSRPQPPLRRLLRKN